MKKLFYGLAIAILLVGIGIAVFQTQKSSLGATGITAKGEKLKAVDLAGIGYVASTTADIIDGDEVAASTAFQFASSTDKTYWDTLKSDYPNKYGATTTAFVFVGDSEMATFNIWFKPKYIGSKLVYELSASNDSDCQNASSTLNVANWFPLPVIATTTVSEIKDIQEKVFTAPAVSTYKWSFTIDDINYQCLKLKFSTNSTTDFSFLYANTVLKLK